MERNRIYASIFFSIGVMGLYMHKENLIKDVKLNDILDRVFDTIDDFEEFFKIQYNISDEKFYDIVTNYYYPKLIEWYGVSE